MNFPDDPRVAEAKRIPVRQVLDKLRIYNLTLRGGEYYGPCPLCGTEGHRPKSGPPDRFNVNVHSKAYLCRKCGIGGGDQIALVRSVTRISFPEALEFLCGELSVDIDPAEAQKRIEIAEKQAKQDEDRQNIYRQRRREEARRFYARSIPGYRGVVGAYLRARGLPLGQIPSPLRFLLDHPYIKKIGGQSVTMHCGPCMIAPIIDWQTDAVMAVHQTWVDINPPHGKALISYQGETYPSKLVRGSKQGNFIPLITPEGTDTLVVGEGIETTLSAYHAQPSGLEHAAYWCGVNRGNMAGKMLKVKGQKYSGLPDLSAEDVFVPPPWVKRLIYIEDGDSAAIQTRAMMECGLRRARHLRPGLQTEIVPTPGGFDLNDVLNGKHHQDQEGQGHDGRN